MQVYKAFLKIIKKNIKSVLIYTIVFMILAFMFSTSAEDNINSNFQSSEMNLVIKDEDGTLVSKALSSYLGEIHTVYDNDWTEEEIKDQLYYRGLDYILTIPAGFSAKIEKGETTDLLESVKLPGSAKGTFVDEQINSYLSSIQTYIVGGFDISEAIHKTNETIDSMEEVKTISFEEQKGSSQIFFFYQYLAYILLAQLMSSMTSVIVILNKKDLSNRITCSNLSATGRGLQTALGSITFSVGLFLLLILLGGFIYGKDMLSTEGLLCMLNAFIFLMVAVAISLFISAFSPGDNVLDMISNIVALGMSFLCGVFVPQAMLGEQVLSVSKFLPAYWYIKANNMLGGMYNAVFDMGTYINCIVIQLLFVAGIFAAYLVVTKVRRQSE